MYHLVLKVRNDFRRGRDIITGIYMKLAPLRPPREVLPFIWKRLTHLRSYTDPQGRS